MKASHNSATGERPLNFWAKWFGCIARCQTKTLTEQYFAGVRLFDIRVRYDKHGVLRCCHGLAEYDMTLRDAFRTLNRLRSDRMAWVMVTYEGSLSQSLRHQLIEDVREEYSSPRTYFALGNISVKKPEWTIISLNTLQPEYKHNYTKIVGWKVLLPFPRLWYRLNPPKPVKDNEISMEDCV